MRQPIPIFHPRVHVPDPAPGLRLDPPAGRCGPVVWLQAQLSWTHDELARRGTSWLRELHVTAISSTDQIPRISSLSQLPEMSGSIDWTELGDGQHRSVGLSFELGALFESPLHAEPLYVHLSCDELCSAPVIVGMDTIEPPRLQTPIVIEDPITALRDAYTLARLEQYGPALALFDALFERDPGMRSNVDACHLYNAACLESRLGRNEAAYLRLREDTNNRVKAHTAALLASYAGSGAQPTQPALDAALIEHLEFAASDPDLAGLGDYRSLPTLLD